MTLHTALKEYMVFSFVTFALVEPFGLTPYIKRRKSLISVFEIIDRVPKIDPDDTSALKPHNVYGSIGLKNVVFSYLTRPEMLVLSKFSLKINGGQTLAVVGVSGSGKSTIISLIERFYDPIAGQVLLDGRDLKLFNLRWLRSHTGLVQQEPIIFSTTVRENIIYARHNASEAEMKEAARIANAHNFMSSLPHGYGTHIEMRGVDLTPGQKQRIAIARVILKNAPILLLDEASSSTESSRVVQEALDNLIMGNKTTILVAHRAAMMNHVDNIVGTKWWENRRRRDPRFLNVKECSVCPVNATSLWERIASTSTGVKGVLVVLCLYLYVKRSRVADYPFANFSISVVKVPQMRRINTTRNDED